MMFLVQEPLPRGWNYHGWREKRWNESGGRYNRKIRVRTNSWLLQTLTGCESRLVGIKLCSKSEEFDTGTERPEI